jgi:hypothetical protein
VSGGKHVRRAASGPADPVLPSLAVRVLIGVVMLGLGVIATVGCAESTMLPPASAAPATSGRIRGVVRIGGSARAGVEVTLTLQAAAPGAPAPVPADGGVPAPAPAGQAPYRASRFTDAAGEVVFNDLPFGDYVMSVRSPSTGRSMGNPVSVSTRAASASVDFELGR